MSKLAKLGNKPVYGKGEVFWRSKDSSFSSIISGASCELPKMSIKVRKTFTIKI